MASWNPPPDEHLPDFRVLEGLLEYGEEHIGVVRVARIVGTSVGAELWNPDWTLREEEIRHDPMLLRYHHGKLDDLLNGNGDRKLAPIRESDLVAGVRPSFKTLDLVEIESVYFVGSGGVHRVAVAHQRGFGWLKAHVLPMRFTSGAPKAARAWVASLKVRAGSNMPVLH